MVKNFILAGSYWSHEHFGVILTTLQCLLVAVARSDVLRVFGARRAGRGHVRSRPPRSYETDQTFYSGPQQQFFDLRPALSDRAVCWVRGAVGDIRYRTDGNETNSPDALQTDQTTLFRSPTGVSSSSVLLLSCLPCSLLQLSSGLVCL